MSSLDHRGTEPHAPGYVEPGGRPKYSGYAGFWIRSVALLLDWLILTIPQFLYIVLIGAAMMAFEGNESLEHAIAIGGYISLIVLIALFCAGMESSRLQGTPGKLVLGLQVTDVNGRRISFGRALGRHCAKILSSTPLAFGFFMAGFTARKQALHDLIAGTFVLKATRPQAWPSSLTR
jgi:uncharacterized RDD family membrane protein YckC